ncbi:hypothetical protein PsorP6_013436 [Peronosclerospora sorghi]|uniref:Uncharacterized protein n=1 Tax=Peronosclerospora sorghi TaxID=230839 RepID=A0ACC0VH00_9STRA|nr:hypothetical protein PsorP6_013436 [Peronosclerospora sorghi]
MNKGKPSRLRHMSMYRFALVLLSLWGFILVLRMTSLPGISKERIKVRTQRTVDVGESWYKEVLRLLGNSTDPLEISGEDLLHLSLLHEFCVQDVEASLTWEFGSPGHQLPNASASNPEVVMRLNDDNLLQKLRQCPDVEIFLPTTLRENGYCEDAVAYVKYLKSRLLHEWALVVKVFDPALNREVDYFDLCPKTPIIFFNHNWYGAQLALRWPKDKPIYMMPNLDMSELEPKHFWSVDAVLCRTKDCFDRVTRWYDQEGNPRDAKVFYTKHTSSDHAHFARKRYGEVAIRPKNFSDVKFIHTAGTSLTKGTEELLKCWVYLPGLPPLDVYIDELPLVSLTTPTLRRMIPYSRSPLKIHVGLVERSAFAKLIAEAALFMCPSTSEGYGHYINQARAAGAVVLTSDLAPMNELISNESGILIPVTSPKNPLKLMVGAYEVENGLMDVDGHVASFKGSDIFDVVQEFIMSTTTEQRAAMGDKARQAYHQDTRFFAIAMQELRRFARHGK